MADRAADRTTSAWGILRKPGHPLDGASAMLIITPGRETLKAQFDAIEVAGKRNEQAFGWHCYPVADFEIRRSVFAT